MLFGLQTCLPWASAKCEPGSLGVEFECIEEELAVGMVAGTPRLVVSTWLWSTRVLKVACALGQEPGELQLG